MTEVLTPKEIDELLTAINESDTEPEDFRPNGDQKMTLDDFESFLTKRKFEPEKKYGIFDKDITMCRFFESKENETILADIERKNIEQNMGNITIPNTSIKLINYSICPKCKTVFSYKDLIEYYKNPKPNPSYKNRGLQLREDTRVCCSECEEYFLPALVIVDGTPRNEVQFLCRMQIVEVVEKFFLNIGQKVFSRNKSNIVHENGYMTIKNDVALKELESKPTLICNLIQYTPINLIPNLIDGSNIEKGDILFGKWNPITY
jgi:hypothetical protein